jgi:hypothetical protein
MKEGKARKVKESTREGLVLPVTWVILACSPQRPRSVLCQLWVSQGQKRVNI